MFGVAVEARDRAQSSGHRCPGSTESLEVTAEALDVGAARTEQHDPMFCTPADVLAQIQLVRFPRQTAIARQEPRDRRLLLKREPLLRTDRHHRCRCHRNELHVRPPPPAAPNRDASEPEH